MIRRLLANDFTDEDFGGIIRKAMRKSAPDMVFDPKHYFPSMWNLMSFGSARAWSGEGSLLVGLFYPQFFTGEIVGVVSLWAGSGKDSVCLLRAFEHEAREMKCVSIHASSFGLLRSASMSRLYRREGFIHEEVSFTKKLERK